VNEVTTSAVFVRDLKKSYGRVEAVRGISFEIATGECFGLLGPNGAGKTTTIEILEGLLEPSSGEVRILGLEWATHEEAIRQRLGVCLQQTVLSEKLTVSETVTLFRAFYREGRDPRETISDVGLTEKLGARVGSLSGGQKQRLAVACALVADPDVLFLDEPTTGLDPQSRRGLWDLVNGYKLRGRTVVLTTHYMDEAERLCDRVAIVDQGQIIALGSPAELIASLGGEHIVEASISKDGEGERAPTGLGSLPGVRSVRIEGGTLFLAVTEPHLAVPALLDHLKAQDLTLGSLGTRHASLEDVFMTLTGRHLRDE
jgi:ABC-2 type transport system ATP-binding protein